VVSSGPESPAASGACPPPPVALTRTARGWSVHSPAGAEQAADLVEGMSLADLVAEEFGALIEPDRTARRSARGSGGAAAEQLDPAQARIAELERTVAQLEHALAARVSTERAIGVLAERHGTSARAAFESLRRDARSQGRPVAELAREVLDGLAAEPLPAPAVATADGAS
jgi:ANTAR domain